MTKTFTLLLSAFLAAGTAAAGPFGLEKGQPKASVDAEPQGGQIYRLKTVPKPHPTFVQYSLQIGEKTGLCRINAGSEMFKNDSFGNEARRTFDAVKDQLVSVYGHADDQQFLRSGALWDEDNEWVMSISQNERVHSVWWTDSKGSKLKDGLRSVALFVGASGRDTSWVMIQYIFENADDCKAEADKAATDSL